MSTLTKSERDGLEDVFSSIQTDKDRYKNIKDLSHLIISKSVYDTTTKLLKHAKYGLKEINFLDFIAFITKKKKNLSK